MLMSLLALYNHDETILSEDYLILPEDVNRNTMTMRLLLDLAELEILIPNPDVLKQAIKFWSLSRLSQWERMVLALSEEYNPLHNFDRYEEWEDTDTGTGSATDTKTGSATDTKTGSGQTGHNSTLTKAGTVTTDENEGIDTTTSESGSSQTDVAGFNSASYAPKDKTTGSSSGSGGSDRELDSTVTTAGTDTLAETGTSSNTETATHSNTETATHSNTDHKTGSHEGHLYGNIGVTTSMQMLTEELKGRHTDIYQIIVDEFKRQFCLMVY